MTAQSRQLLSIVNDLEAIGDLIETDLVGLGLNKVEKRLTMSAGTRAMLEGLQRATVDAVSQAVDAVRNADPVAAESVITQKVQIQQLVDEGDASLARRLRADAPNRLELYAMEVSVIEKLRRIYYFGKRIAKTALPYEEQAADEAEAAVAAE